MTERRSNCGTLGEWRLDAGSFRHTLDRRTVFGSALTGAAALLLAGKPAAALTRETISPAALGAIPERHGVLPWRTLALAEIEHGSEPIFPAAVQKLNGREVVVEGHMMTLEDSPRLQRFLLTAYQAHCPFCMPGGAASMIAVRAEAAIAVRDKPLTLRGTLRVGPEQGSSLVYRLENARIA